ncbi:MAG: chromosome segregation protein SMC [Burkholderiaceae bacterium]
MRLTQLRLSGFKSFVDPTSLQVSRQLVGIVGPNGCGKSNVIDAVRWVLGESRAAELRGENMQDVIFNGSGARKPAGRASVELIFDNSAGRLGGPWGRFAELSVKRVLSRDGQSAYQINGQAVRRKDVYDVFLGTGLGPRAYAIIGQGMISRVIESKPEELRVFLEEAAGVSKYRERRRETEHRLSDAKENLSRVDDIRIELQGRLEQLEGQAEIASTYQQKTEERAGKQSLLLAIRRHESKVALEAHEAERQRLLTSLEALQADVRSQERQLEEARQAAESAQAVSQAAQASLYEINTDIARQETEDRGHVQGRDKAVAAIQVLTLTLEGMLAESEQIQQAVAEAQAALVESQSACERLDAKAQAARVALAPDEAELDAMQGRLTEARATLAAAQADARALDARQQELQRQQSDWQAQLERLEQERASMERLDPTALASILAQQREAEALAQQAAATVASQQSALDTAALAHEAAQQAWTQARAAQDAAAAQCHAQRDLLRQLEANEQLDPWLDQQAWGRVGRLWSALRVADGWQEAIGGLLADRLGAALLEPHAGGSQLLSGLKPPARLHLVDSQGPASAAGAQPTGPWKPLASAVLGDDAAALAARHWMAGLVMAESLDEALAQRASLPDGLTLVTRSGDQVSRHHVTLSGASGDGSAATQVNVLALRDRVASLERAQRAAEIHFQEADRQLKDLEARLAAARQGRQQAGESETRARARAHELELAAVRLQEKQTRLASAEQDLAKGVTERQTALETCAERLRALSAERSASSELLAGLEAQVSQLVATQASSAETVASLRSACAAVERELQEQRLQERSNQERRHRLADQLEDLARRQEESRERVAQLALEQASAEQALAQSPLQHKLSERVAREAALQEARRLADEAAHNLRQLDEHRLSLERQAIPIRDQLSQADASRAAALATIEQIEQQTADQSISLEAVVGQWPNGLPPPDLPRPSTLQTEINRLGREIEALGPVNLAALQELEQGRERKGFLDAQAADLMSAVETLEDAIRKIDRESRALLQSTYDTVNQNFSDLFPRLFGGGEARLVLTGEEILDSGVQVMAQPPGKKNATIHLLSGGEKALTATALVFALFQLNPAPFCLLDEVDAPLDDPNTERLCGLIKEMSAVTQFIFITHNKIAMGLAEHLVGVTMQEQGVSRLVAVDLESANALVQEAA